jgi:hypothetical protein
MRALSFVLAILVCLIVSPVLAIGGAITLSSYTLAYARRSDRRGAQRMAAMRAATRLE